MFILIATPAVDGTNGTKRGKEERAMGDGRTAVRGNRGCRIDLEAEAQTEE